jgi:hypothetical protein
METMKPSIDNLHEWRGFGVEGKENGIFMFYYTKINKIKILIDFF